jgi:hypothetical protein
MKVLKRTAAASIVAIVIAGGVTASAMAGGASISRSHNELTSTSHVVANKAATCTKSTKKPIVTTCKFNATYHGTISIVWNQSGPTTASITGAGAGAEFGLTAISGSGTTTATAQSDPINGTGVLSGKGMTLHLKIATATATAASGSAPTVVTVSGSAKVTSGAGYFKGATGTLTVSGEFSIQNTSGSEKDAFSATLKGVVTIK